MRILKTLPIWILSAAPLMASGSEVVRLSEPVEVGSDYEVFGAAPPNSANVLSLSELIENSDLYMGEEVTVETRIQPRGGFGYDAGMGSSRVVGSACSCLAGEDSGGSAEARVASAVRNNPPVLVGMPEKMVNNFYAPE